MAFKKKESHEERIAKAQGKLAEAQSMFVKAKEEVDIADSHLDSVVEDAQAKIAELQATLKKAHENKVKNEAFKAKLSEFIDFN